MRNLKKGLAAALLAFASSSPNAAVVNFGTGPAQWLQTYTQDDFRVDAATTEPFVMLDTFDCGPSCADNGSTYLGTLRSFAQGRFTPSVVLSKIDHSAFSISSFDSAEFPNSGEVMFATASGVRLIGRMLDDSSVTQDFLFDGVNDGTGGAADFQTFYTSRFSSITELQFIGIEGNGGDFAIDNLMVSVPITEVPEPTSVALFGFGIAGLLVSRRKRK